MSLLATKYPNNERVVSGTVNVNQNDVVLLCDTSSAPVIINLQTIPSSDSTYTGQGNWSTQYKLYIVDYAQNCSINNITVVAPVGFKINATTSQVINNNGGSLMIRVVSNVDYLGTGALSAVAGANIPYIIVKKQLSAVGTVFYPQNTNYSVRAGAVVPAVGLVASTGIMVNSINPLTGVFAVPATGVYNLNLNICCQINPNKNIPTDSVGGYWVTNPTDVGNFAIALCSDTEVIMSNNKAVTQNTSDIIISASAMNIPLTAKSAYNIFILNRTTHDVVGVGDAANRLLLSIHKIA